MLPGPVREHDTPANAPKETLDEEMATSPSRRVQKSRRERGEEVVVVHGRVVVV